MYQALTKVLTVIVATKHGQLGLWGFVLSAGSAYYMLDRQADYTIGSMVFIAGLLMIGISVPMAIVRARHEARLKIMELDAEARRQRREAGEPDRTVYDWRDS